MASVRLEAVTQFAPQPDRPRSDATPLVSEISFSVPDGEFWVLVGPSGCGKSTILRTIAGLLPVSTGQVYIGDRLVNAVPARQRDVAMVFQNYALYPHMSVAQNLAFGLKMRGIPRAERQTRVDAIAAVLGLTQLLDRKPAQLSGGQQQRVALGRSLARQPQVFLLDEPLSNLDAQLRDETRSELRQLHQRFGITTLYVTHDQTEAMTLADQLIVLDRGKVQQIGPPQQVYAEPINTTVATFLGSPPMNLLSVRYDRTQLWLGETAVGRLDPSQLSDATPLLGIRPDQVQVAETKTTGLSARILTVEPLGREVLIQARLPDEQTLKFYASPQAIPSVGCTLPLRLSAPAFVFDVASGKRLAILNEASMN
ncbi:MAG: ABC transporter ATP-binding protein [Cyanobacteria bacterium J06628_6]